MRPSAGRATLQVREGLANGIEMNENVSVDLRSHAVELGSYSSASLKRLVARGGDNNQNASSTIEVVKEIAAGT
eukprot:310685-Pleurochrysis_carterae.AAC.1